MIPFSSPIDFVSSLYPDGESEELWYIFPKHLDFLLTSSNGREIPSTPPSLIRRLYLGTMDNKHLFAGEIDPQEPIPPGWVWSPLRTLFEIICDKHFSIAGHAIQLLEWDRSNRFCGCCSNPTIPRKKERCRECTSCGFLAYPKLSPAMIALVKKEDKILLAKGPHQPFYSAIAGFMEPGETLEQCVVREVFEEVGITVKNISYFGSQPWPFSRSLMIGFTCEWKSGEIQIEPKEIQDASWFTSSNLPLLPPPLSISRILIDAHCGLDRSSSE